MSVDVNGIQIPAKDVLKYSVKFCAPLLFQNESEDHPMSVGGSCFLFRFKRRFFQIATQHQLDNLHRNAGEVRIALPQGSETKLLSPWKSYATTALPIGDTESDFRLWEYDTSLDPKYSLNFLGIRKDHFSTVPPIYAERVIVYYTVAFPNIAQKVDLDESEIRSVRLRTNWAEIHLEPDTEALKLIDTRTYMRSVDKLTDLNLSVDGFSGAPVFVIYQLSDSQCKFGFCGLITHGNDDGRLAVFPASELLSAIDQA